MQNIFFCSLKRTNRAKFLPLCKRTPLPNSSMLRTKDTNLGFTYTTCLTYKFNITFSD